MVDTFLSWFNELLTGFATAGSWLTSPIGEYPFDIAPLWLITFGGLTAFIIVAIVKWVIS